MSDPTWLGEDGREHVGYERMADGSREPLYGRETPELRALDERMAEAMRARIEDRKRGITGPHLGWCPPMEESVSG